jgi:hypothetical protein
VTGETESLPIPWRNGLDIIEISDPLPHLLKCNRCERKGMEVKRGKWDNGVSRGWRPGER